MKMGKCWDCGVEYIRLSPTHIRCGSIKTKTGCSYKNRLKKERFREKTVKRKTSKQARNKSDVYRKWNREYQQKYRQKLSTPNHQD